MPGPEMDLKRELVEAGNRLLTPPDEVDELLPLLNRAEYCLSFVEQQPAVGIQDALCPTFRALIANPLLKHPDTDVRLGVTACLTEISRITAPDVPYNDDIMMELFKLTISSFEGLSDISSISFSKRLSILEIVARVRSAAVLLDLECNDLVVDMFQIFYKCIRDSHTDVVFASMESIMSLIIEESEEISTELLLALFFVLRKDNKDALPIARKLGEKVVQNCATTLKPYIVEGIKSLKINLLDYDFVITTACQVTRDRNRLQDNVLSDAKVNGSESASIVEDVAQVVVVAPASNDNTVAVEDAPKEPLNITNKTDSLLIEQTSEIILKNKISVNDISTSDIGINLEPSSSLNLEPKCEIVVKKRGRKPKIAKEIVSQPGSSELPHADSKKSSEVNIHTGLRKAAPEDSSDEPNVVENKSDSSNKHSSLKVMENNVITLGSSSHNDSVRGKKFSKRNRKSKKVTSNCEKTPSRQRIKDDTPDGLDGIETILLCSEKDSRDGLVDTASKLISVVEVKKEQNNEAEPDTLLKQSTFKLGVIDGTPSRKKRGRPRKDVSVTVAAEANDRVCSEGTSKKQSRQRFTPTEDGKEYGEELVGSKIQVWWPIDMEYYDGIVESFDPVKRKHKVLYIDNEREVLNLRKQKWKLVTSSEGSEKNGVAFHANGVDSSDIHHIHNNTLKMDSDSVGKSGNTGTPPQRRGRPPKNVIAIASAGKDTKPEAETNARKFKIDSMADGKNTVKSVESLSNSLRNLNDMFKDSDHEQEVPEDYSTQTGKISTLVTGLAVDVARKEATAGIGINETLALGSDVNPILNETTTPISRNSDVNMTEVVNPSGGSKTEGLNTNKLASDAAKKPRKRKTRTCSDSSSSAVPGSPDTLVKRRPGRPRLSVGTSDDKSEVLKKQLGDSKIDESRSGSHSDNIVVVNSEDSLVGGQSKPNVNAELRVSEHCVLDKNATNSTDSVIMGTNADVLLEQISGKSTSVELKSGSSPMGLGTNAVFVLEQISSKSTSGELKSGSSPRLEFRLNVSDTEPKLGRKRARKSTSSYSEKVKKDGPVKRPRGRPSKPKTRDTEVNVSLGNGSESRPVFKSGTSDVSNIPKKYVIADVVAKDELRSSIRCTDEVDLKLGSAAENKGDGASEKCPEYEMSKEEKMTKSAGSSKEQESETHDT